MKQKRVQIGLGIVMASALVLSGCGGGGEETDAETPMADSGEVVWWGWTPDGPINLTV